MHIHFMKLVYQFCFPQLKKQLEHSLNLVKQKYFHN